MPSTQPNNHSVSKRVAQSSRNATCKTCLFCRQKKVKCDGSRPRCRACEANSQECTYPQDARKDSRPSTAKVQTLEANLAALWQHMKVAGHLVPGASMEPEMPALRAMMGEGPLVDVNLPSSASQNYQAHCWPPSPPQTDISPSVAISQTRNHRTGSYVADERANLPPGSPLQVPFPAEGDRTEPSCDGSSMTSCEARVAGVIRSDGEVSVHGLASILNPNTPPAVPKKKEQEVSNRDALRLSSQARLISNAALQNQSETIFYNQPSSTVDLDGVDPELARHLLDLHWNRQHYAYLISYRPAVMDSLFNGGPWANKLLLNAIFYSSTFYSDRGSLRNCNNDLSRRFLDRFKALLGDEILRPSIPSCMGLLLCGATLVSGGQSSAGWTLCGTAYRMIIDLGAHLIPEPSEEHIISQPRKLKTDIEHEMRKRLYWGAFVTDATQSLYLGRSPTLPLTEARVPQELLDTFEELEQWSPYIDRKCYSSSDHLLLSYEPRPAYAVTTFNAIARLAQISARISQDIYSINCIKCTTAKLKDSKLHLEKQLQDWLHGLPAHLRFDPDVDPIPPPHQITPHTTFHALGILLQRPWLSEGHLRRRSNDSEKVEGEKVCIQHALAISKLVDAYRRAFTLRRAPFLLSYAVYSAVIVILKQGKQKREELKAIVAFFWDCLTELQRGCNFGLKKPLAILRNIMAEMDEIENDLPNTFTLDNPLVQMVDNFTNASNADTGPSPGLSIDGMDLTAYDGFDMSMNFLDDQERMISDDALYGLFAPSNLTS